MTFCACTRPLKEVVLLWDFLLAYGLHLNVLCVLSQLLLLRDEILSSPKCISFFSPLFLPSFYRMYSTS
jgi:hypothetical protein